MSESVDIGLIFNQIDEDPSRDYHELLRRLPTDIFALRTSTGTEDGSSITVPSVVVSGATQRTYDVVSDRADMATVSYAANDDPSKVEQLTYIDGVLWHTREDVSEQVSPTLDGVQRAVTVSLALCAARGSGESAF